MRFKVIAVVFVLAACVLFAFPFAGAAEEGGIVEGDSSSGGLVSISEPVAEGDCMRWEMVWRMPPGTVDTSALALAPSIMQNSLYASDGFESGMGSWTLSGNPTWGTTTYRAASGSYSAYCIGSAYTAPSYYPTWCQGWMKAGPFDLSNAVEASVEYDQWLSTSPPDACSCFYSLDGTNWYGVGYGGSSGGWVHRSRDLADALGDTSVWIGFQFWSDYMNSGEGVYLDNVRVVSVDRKQQNNSNLGYVRAWSTLANAKASGGSSFECSSGGANVSIKFTGDYLGWIARTSSGQGKARVTLDYGTPQTVDLYSATPAWQKTVWETPGDLSWDTHKVFIEYTGTKNSSATGWGINVDAFDVRGSLLEAPLRYQHNRGDVRYSGPAGTWVTNWNNYASYLSIKRSNTKDSTFRVKFTGSHIAWVGLKAPAYGRASITLDGVYKGTVSLYAPTQQWERKIWAGSTPYGEHTLLVTCTGAKDSASSGYYIDADAFDIQGVLGWE